MSDATAMKGNHPASIPNAIRRRKRMRRSPSSTAGEIASPFIYFPFKRALHVLINVY
jgi:hypothetical protein